MGEADDQKGLDPEVIVSSETPVSPASFDVGSRRDFLKNVIFGSTALAVSQSLSRTADAATPKVKTDVIAGVKLGKTMTVADAEIIAGVPNPPNLPLPQPVLPADTYFIPTGIKAIGGKRSHIEIESPHLNANEDHLSAGIVRPQEWELQYVEYEHTMNLKVPSLPTARHDLYWRYFVPSIQPIGDTQIIYMEASGTCVGTTFPNIPTAVEVHPVATQADPNDPKSRRAAGFEVYVQGAMRPNGQRAMQLPVTVTLKVQAYRAVPKTAAVSNHKPLKDEIVLVSGTTKGFKPFIDTKSKVSADVSDAAAHAEWVEQMGKENDEIFPVIGLPVYQKGPNAVPQLLCTAHGATLTPESTDIDQGSMIVLSIGNTAHQLKKEDGPNVKWLDHTKAKQSPSNVPWDAQLPTRNAALAGAGTPPELVGSTIKITVADPAVDLSLKEQPKKRAPLPPWAPVAFARHIVAREKLYKDKAAKPAQVAAAEKKGAAPADQEKEEKDK